MPMKNWDTMMKKLSYLQKDEENYLTKSSLGFDVLFVDGHTEKQMIPIIDYRGQKIAFGDLSCQKNCLRRSLVVKKMPLAFLVVKSNAKQCKAMHSKAMQSNAEQSKAKQCKAMQCKTKPSNA